MNPTSAPAPVPIPAAIAKPKTSSLRNYAVGGVARVVGYGLVAMFLVDLPPIALTYVQHPFDPQMDGTLVAQVLERVAVPLIGFAMIFAWEAHDLPRWERILRKFISYGMLVCTLGSLAFGALAISSGVRQYSRAAATADYRTNQRVSALTTLGKQAGTLDGVALRSSYASLVHADTTKPPPPVEQMRREIATTVPATIDAVYAAARRTKTQGLRDELGAAGKYAIDAVISAVVFFVLWEASSTARAYRIFRQKNAPSLGVEGAVIDGIANVGRKMEGIRILPNLEDYAWYRRLRRKWRHRNDRKHR